MVSRSEVASGMQIDWDVPIEMDDGVVLRADVFRPPGEARSPVLMTHGPYGKNLPFEQGWPLQWHLLTTEWPEVLAGTSGRYHVWETVDPEKWVPEGYAVVRVDSRGAGRSPGFLDPFSPRETRDFAACIEWGGAQPWSSGKVGLNGISYYAINQWLVAGLQPAYLTAMCAWEGAADSYRDRTYHGGILSTFGTLLAQMQILRVQHGLGERGLRNEHTGEYVCGEQTLSDEELRANRVDVKASPRAHPLDDEFHRERSANWERVEVPFLSAASWGGQGLHPRGNYEAFMRAASREKWLECHGYSHWTTFYTNYGRELQLRFFGHFLKGEDTWSEQPRVQLQVRHAGERYVPRAETQWPLAGTRWTRLYLHADELGLADAPASHESSVRYTPLGDGVTFRAPAWERDVEITGPLAAKLWVSSATVDADLFLVVRLFDPDGAEVLFQGTVDPRTPIAQGWLRASHRTLDPRLSQPWRPYHSHDESESLQPGQVYELDMEIWPTCIVVPAGHHLALTVRGSDFDHGLEGVPVGDTGYVMRGCAIFFHDDPTDRSQDLFGGDVTLHTGGDTPSHLLVPVIPSSRS